MAIGHSDIVNNYGAVQSDRCILELQRNLLPPYSLKMETAGVLEKLVGTCQTAGFHN